MTESSDAMNFNDFELGTNHETLTVDTSKDNQAAVLAMLKQARRTIEVFSDNLDPRILDDADVCSAISQFIRISPNSSLRILLKDSSRIVTRGHRWIEMSRKFDSYIKIRKTHDDYQTTPYNFIIVDGRGLIYRPNAESYYAVVDFSAGAECRQHQEFFSEVWEMSSTDPELNRLYL